MQPSPVVRHCSQQSCRRVERELKLYPGTAARHACANKTDPSLHFNSMNCSVVLRVSRRCAHEQKKSVNTYESNQVAAAFYF